MVLDIPSAKLFENFTFGTTNNNISQYSTTMPRSYESAVCDITQPQSLENILYVLLLSIILFLSVVGNLFVITAGLLSRQLRSRVTIYFIISLATSDLISSSFSIPFKISSKLYSNRFCYDLSTCYVVMISDAIGNLASILNLFLIAIDRFLAIKLPFRYTVIMTKRNSKYFILSVWLFSFFWAIIGVFRWQGNGSGADGVKVAYNCTNENYFYYAASFVIYLVIFVIITGTYCTILSVAMSQIKAIEKNEKITCRLLVVNDEDKERFKKKRRSLKRELKATKSVAIVYLAFTICWMPSAVINIILLFDNEYFAPMQQTNKSMFLFIYYFCVDVLPIFNTMVNPIIYSFANKQFREAFKKVISKLTGKQFINSNASLSKITTPVSVSMSMKSPNRIKFINGRSKGLGSKC